MSVLEYLKNKNKLIWRVIKICQIKELKLGFHVCDNQVPVVIIMHGDEQLNICSSCWEKLAEHEGWGSKWEEREECPKPLFGMT